MSKSLIDRSHDLKKLRNEGYDIEVTCSGHLLLKGVPYVTKEGCIRRGVLVSDLELEMGPDGEVTKNQKVTLRGLLGIHLVIRMGVLLFRSLSMKPVRI